MTLTNDELHNIFFVVLLFFDATASLLFTTLSVHALCLQKRTKNYFLNQNGNIGTLGAFRIEFYLWFSLCFLFLLERFLWPNYFVPRSNCASVCRVFHGCYDKFQKHLKWLLLCSRSLLCGVCCFTIDRTTDHVTNDVFVVTVIVTEQRQAPPPLGNAIKRSLSLCSCCLCL